MYMRFLTLVHYCCSAYLNGGSCRPYKSLHTAGQSNMEDKGGRTHHPKYYNGSRGTST